MQYIAVVDGVNYIITPDKLTYIAENDYRMYRWVDNQKTKYGIVFRFHLFQNQPVFTAYDDFDTPIARKPIHLPVLKGLNPKNL